MTEQGAAEQRAESRREPAGRREPAADTLPLPVVAPHAGGAPTKRRRRRRVGWIVAGIVVVALAGAAVAGEFVFRAVATAQVAKTVEQSLPSGVTGSVHARLGGTSVLWQWLHGSFDDVTLTTSDLKINGGAASASVHVQGLPTTDSGTVRSATGTLTVSQATVRSLEPLKAADVGEPTLGDGSISTSLQRTVLGIPITVGVTLTPSLAGDTIHLKPVKAQLTSGFVSVPGTALVQALLPDGISVCTAQYLPPGLALTGLEVREGSATLEVRATDLALDALEQGKTGHC